MLWQIANWFFHQKLKHNKNKKLLAFSHLPKYYSQADSSTPDFTPVPAFTFVVSQFSLICICSFIMAVKLEMVWKSCLWRDRVRICGCVPFWNNLICEFWHKQIARRKKKPQKDEKIKIKACFSFRASSHGYLAINGGMMLHSEV